MLTNNQLASVFERLATVAVSYAVGAGFIDAGDEHVWSALLIAVCSGAYALYSNRSKRLAERAADAGMTVIAPAKIADKSNSPGVISAETFVATRK